MRFKLGLLQDTATIEKQVAREAAEVQAKKHRHPAPTVKTEAQTKAEEEIALKEKDKSKGQSKEPPKPKPKIRPLSEAKAIDSGANFVSETFLLLVGVALIVGENWRQGRKASSRREDVAERLGELEEYEKSARRGMVELEREIIRLRAKESKLEANQQRILPKKVWELEEREEAEEENPRPRGWLSWIREKTLGSPPEVEAESRPPPEPELELKPKPKPPENTVSSTHSSTTSSILDRILASKTSGPSAEAAAAGDSSRSRPPSVPHPSNEHNTKR